jgi:hypothetical protein
VSTHVGFWEVGGVEGLAIMISFHSAAGSLDVLAVGHQHIVDFRVLIGDSFPVVDDGGPVKGKSESEHGGIRVHPVSGFPVNVADRVLDESDEVLEPSSFVAPVVRLFAQSVLFKFPVVLLSHRSELRSRVPVDRLQSFGGIGCAIIKEVKSVVSTLSTVYLTLSPSSTGAFLTQR